MSKVRRALAEAAASVQRNRESDLALVLTAHLSVSATLQYIRTNPLSYLLIPPLQTV